MWHHGEKLEVFFFFRAQEASSVFQKNTRIFNLFSFLIYIFFFLDKHVAQEWPYSPPSASHLSSAGIIVMQAATSRIFLVVVLLCQTFPS